LVCHALAAIRDLLSSAVVTPRGYCKHPGQHSRNFSRENRTVSFVSITRPTANQTLSSPVAVAGTCSPGGRTVTMDITHGTTVTASQTVTANGTNWTATGVPLASNQNYTAGATAGGDSDSKDFKVQ